MFALDSLHLGQRTLFRQDAGGGFCISRKARVAGFEGDRIQIRLDHSGDFILVEHTTLRFEDVKALQEG